MFETESESLKLLDRLGLFRIPESFVVSISKIRFWLSLQVFTTGTSEI